MCTYMYILDRMCVAPILAYTLHMCIYYVCSAITDQEVDKWIQCCSHQDSSVQVSTWESVEVEPTHHSVETYWRYEFLMPVLCNLL